MTSLHIEESSIPQLDEKIAVITGAASGIGLATAELLAERGAKVLILDLHPPQAQQLHSRIEFKKCDVTIWTDVRDALLGLRQIDMVFANAGISEHGPFLEDDLATDQDGSLREPTYPVMDVNLRSVLNIIKLSWSIMKKQKSGGSIVLTSSSTAYAPELSIPLYSALKMTLVGLVRSLRSVLPAANISINAVAPAATYTPLVSQDFLNPIVTAGLPVNSARAVGLALAYSATASQSRRVEAYGREDPANDLQQGRWNGRVIMILGNQYTEIEEPLAKLRPLWLGSENEKLTRAQQAQTDSRHISAT